MTAGVEVGQKALEGFDELCNLLEVVGAGESKPKASYPHETVVFLGILFNTLTMTMSITPERIQEILDTVTIWCDSKIATRKQVQHILGKLHFICKCVRQGRVFVNRILNFLRGMPEIGEVEVQEEFRKDLLWFHKFLPLYNGVSLIPPAKFGGIDETVACDACLEGCGGICGLEYFHTVFPEYIVDLAGDGYIDYSR